MRPGLAPFLAPIIGLLLLTACQEQTTIRLTLKGYEQDTTLYLTQYCDRSFLVIDSLHTTNGQAIYQAHLDPQAVYGLSPDNLDRHPLLFIPDSPDIRLSLWPGSIATEGSPESALLQRTLLQMQSQSLDGDTLVARHPTSTAMAYVTSRYLVSQLPLDSLTRLDSQFDASMADHPYIRTMRRTLGQMQRLRPGCFAPTIPQAPRGTELLVLFWASWCPDCRAEMPHIQEYLAIHSDVCLVAISLDEDRATARESARRNGLCGTILCDGLAWQGPLVQDYAICAIPTLLRIDKMGRIVGYGLE